LVIHFVDDFMAGTNAPEISQLELHPEALRRQARGPNRRLTHTILDEVTSFRHQIALVIGHLSNCPEGLFSGARFRRSHDKVLK
jgi:hypothetical protein